MPASRVLHILQTIDRCITTNKAKRMKDIALELDLSERQMFKYLKLMKKLGAPIQYNRKSKQYEYTGPGHFHIGFIRRKKHK